MKIKELKEWLNEYDDEATILRGISETDTQDKNIFYIGDLIDYIIAEEGCERYLKNGSKATSLDEVKRIFKIK